MWTRESVQKILEEQTWVYAKTMPWCPHFYTRAFREWKQDRGVWTSMVRFMFDPANSDVEPWGKGKWKRDVTYFRVGGWRYWGMEKLPEDIDKIDLINRAKEPQK